MLRPPAFVFCATIAILGVCVSPAFAEGEFRTKQYEEGGIYEGMFKDGVRHGTGTYTLPDGFTYKGQWVNGEIQGQGIAKYPNGSLFEGQFSDGKPNGQGTITFADGGSYQGDWLNGKITGQGTAKYANGSIYTGGFKEADHHGFEREHLCRRNAERQAQWDGYNQGQRLDDL